MAATLTMPVTSFDLHALAAVREPSWTAKADGSSLVEDQRGAVMLTGLFMACFLIGALWFVMGIGDAVVFRDRMQEAADSGAFTSASLHAKGMNFISLCNLVMLVGTVIHLILGIVSDVMAAIAIVACGSAVLTAGATIPACMKAAEGTEKVYKAWDNYFKVMSRGFKAIHVGQKVASYAYPGFGVVEALENGSKYGNDRRTGPVRVVAVSASLVPGAAFRFAERKATKDPKRDGAVTKEGLPVQRKPFSHLCKKVVSVSSNGVANLTGIGKDLSGETLSGKALKTFNDLVGKSLAARYCNKMDLHFWPLGPGFDSFWDEDGPFVMYEPAKNGNVWMQTWALNIAPSLNDTSESHVGIAARKDAKYTKKEQPLGYVAQAEFYFDCDAKWNTPACNFDENATFAVKWRARMRRVELPALASGVVGASLDAITKLPEYKDAKDALKEKIAKKIAKEDDTNTKSFKRKLIENLVGKGLDLLERELKKAANESAKNFDPKLSDLGLTSYH